jgi:hypothetical protein
MNLKRTALCYAAGTVGGLANSIAVWLFGTIGVTATLGVKLVPAFTAKWLYPRLVWGGLWGFLFLLSFMRQMPYRKGLVLSLAPTLAQLFIVFPYVLDKGMFGLELGVLTPALVFLFNAVWGLATAALLVNLDRT